MKRGGKKQLAVFVPLTAQLGGGAKWNVRASKLAENPSMLRCFARPITLCLIEFDCSLWHDRMTVCGMRMGPLAGCETGWQAGRRRTDSPAEFAQAVA